jgi:hypothetical protein
MANPTRKCSLDTVHEHADQDSAMHFNRQIKQQIKKPARKQTHKSQENNIQTLRAYLAIIVSSQSLTQPA